jgi:hypothetical protein
MKLSACYQVKKLQFGSLNGKDLRRHRLSKILHPVHDSFHYEAYQSFYLSMVQRRCHKVTLYPVLLNTGRLKRARSYACGISKKNRQIDDQSGQGCRQSKENRDLRGS